MLFYKIFNLKQEEFKLFLYAASFIFLLFASYAILRPLRDAFGIEGGDKEIKWLFLATFITTLLASLLAMWLSTRVKRKNYLNAIYLFFALTQSIFWRFLLLFCCLQVSAPFCMWSKLESSKSFSLRVKHAHKLLLILILLCKWQVLLSKSFLLQRLWSF